MSTFARSCLAAVSTLALGLTVLAGPSAATDEPPPQDPPEAGTATVNLLTINDFHGRIDENAVAFAGTVEQLREAGGEAETLFVSNGDGIGASLFTSAVQQDLPTLDLLNALDLDVSAVGNHEFDQGWEDLAGRVTEASDFGYLGANVVYRDSGEPALDAYEIFAVGDLDVAVVGAVTEETPALVLPDGIAMLQFTDPVDAMNDAVAELQALDEVPDVIIANVHEGGPGSDTLEDALAASPVFEQIVTELDAEVDAIVTGHTHQEYIFEAPVPGDAERTRPVIQTGSYGDNVGQIELTVDVETGDVLDYTAQNHPRTETPDAELVSTYPRVKEVQGIVQAAEEFAAEIGNEPVGEITADITTAYTGDQRDDRAAESTLGNLVADAMFAAVEQTPAGADLAMMNPGGLRADLFFDGDTSQNPANTDGVVTFAEANAVLPFANSVESVTVTGDEVKEILEQQWQRDAEGNVPSRDYLQLGLSSNVSYTFDASREEGDRITSIVIDGEPIVPAADYRIAVQGFLAGGGDNFHAFTEGERVDTGLLDYEAWISYLEDNTPVSPDFGRRALEVGGLEAEYAGGETVEFELPSVDLTSLGSPANTEVEVTVEYGDGTTQEVGSVAVTDGAATIVFDVPAEVSDTDATVTVEAAPSGTVGSISFAVTPGDDGGAGPGDPVQELIDELIRIVEELWRLIGGWFGR